MKAMILAAGQGMHLRLLTEHMPKCMIPAGGKPVLEHTFENHHIRGRCIISAIRDNRLLTTGNSESNGGRWQLPQPIPHRLPVHIMGDVGNYRNLFHTACQRATACSPRVAARAWGWPASGLISSDKYNGGRWQLPQLIPHRLPAGHRLFPAGRRLGDRLVREAERCRQLPPHL